MKKYPITILHPEYYTRFSCIGPACEDTCCGQDWAIVIDKSTYKKYKKVQEPVMANLFKTGMKTMKDGTNGAYAQFVLGDDNHCPFFDTDRLCMIQKKLGESALCDTCKIYPRISKMVRQELRELSMSATCPEMVRIALLPKEPIKFSISEFQVDGSEFFMKARYKPLSAEDAFGETGKYAWEIREACIDLLQCRNMGIEKRIFVVGMMLNKITEMAREEQFGRIPNICAAFVAGAKSGDFADVMDSVAENFDRQAGMQSILIRYIMDIGSKRPNDYVICQQFIASIGTWMQARSLSDANFTQMYGYVQERINLVWPGFLVNWGHVLENYLVNMVFSLNSLFKYPALTPYQHFIILVEQYSMIRMLLCVLASESGEVEEALLVEVITTLCTDVMHNDTAKRVIEAYGHTGNDTLAHMAFLLR